MAERKWKKISTWMAAWVMAVVFAVSGAQTAFAATSYVNSVSITLDVTPTVGESLPDLDVGYNSDNCEVSIPNNDKYRIRKVVFHKERREDRRNLYHESYFKDFK